MIPDGLVPLVVSIVSQQVARAYAGTKPPAQQPQAFALALKVAGWLAIVGSLVWSLVGLWQVEPASNRGTGLYGLLGLDARATAREIGRGFRERGIKLHPDKHPELKTEYQSLSMANEILKNPTTRFFYDGFGQLGVDVYLSGAPQNVPLSQMFTDLFISNIWSWSVTSFWVVLSSWLSGGAWQWHVVLLMLLSSLDSTLVSRTWFEWYLPLPPFQVGVLLRKSVPAMVGGLNLLFPPLSSPLEVALARVQHQSVQGMVLAQRRFDQARAPFEWKTQQEAQLEKKNL